MKSYIKERSIMVSINWVGTYDLLEEKNCIGQQLLARFYYEKYAA